MCRLSREQKKMRDTAVIVTVPFINKWYNEQLVIKCHVILNGVIKMSLMKMLTFIYDQFS